MVSVNVTGSGRKVDTGFNVTGFGSRVDIGVNVAGSGRKVAVWVAPILGIEVRCLDNVKPMAGSQKYRRLGKLRTALSMAARNTSFWGMNPSIFSLFLCRDLGGEMYEVIRRVAQIGLRVQKKLRGYVCDGADTMIF